MKKHYLIICLLTTLVASSVLMTGEALGDGFDRRMGLEGWLMNAYPSHMDNGCVYSSCYGSSRDIIFPGEAFEVALNESLLLNASPGWSISRVVWNEVKSCVESDEALQAGASNGFFSCKRGVLAQMNAYEWEILTDDYLDAISAGGLFGENFKDKSPGGVSKIILWDEVDGSADDGAKFAGDLRINRP